MRVLLGAVLVGAIALILLSSGSDDPPPQTPAQRAAAEQRRLDKLERDKARASAERRRDPAVRRETARLKAEQKPHFGAVPPGPLSRKMQRKVVAALERDIMRDAQRRYRAGKLDQPTRDAVCTHFVRPNVPHPPPPPVSAKRAGYECLAVTIELGPAGAMKNGTITGFPFWARVNFRTGRYAWCKVNLTPGEHGIGGTLAEVPLSPVCDPLGDAGRA
jgi:hypothetical protein